MARYNHDRFMEAQFHRDKALIGRCVDGLGLYAAQIAEENKFSSKINEVRNLAENLANYWGFEDGTNTKSTADFLKAFDDLVDEARTGGALSGDIYQTAPNVIYGLHRYGEDMVTSLGAESMNDILEVRDLMKDIAKRWDFESDVLDGLTEQLEFEVRNLLESSPLPGQPVVGVVNAGYTVTQSVLFDNDRGFALAHNPAAPSPFVTWQITHDSDNGGIDYYWGRYRDTEESAKIDYVVRATEYRSQYNLQEKPLPDVAPDTVSKYIDTMISRECTQDEILACREFFATVYESAAKTIDPAKLVYPFDIQIARERSEVDVSVFHSNRKMNTECAKALDEVISASYYKANHYNLELAAMKVINDYGFDRVNAVLAKQIDSRQNDGRFSDHNKCWRRTYCPNTKAFDSAVMNAHPTLINSFVSNVRELYKELDASRFELPGRVWDGEAIDGYKIAHLIEFDNGQGFVICVSPDDHAPYATLEYVIEDEERVFYEDV
ncbi:MAG: DUF3849 domain-containing protein, partial [Defluviitaleaceae bacterium]|nr:DUF3849 domain-containing protein [Defluviitaleaceae bacterium]